MRLICIMLLTFALVGCNTVSDLHYVPSTSIQASSTPSISAVTATDLRKEAPTRLATIMGGFGNPLKTLDTAKPVKDEIADTFTEGLRVRGLLAPAGQAPYRLVLVIRKFDADMIMGRTARIDLTISTVDQTGHEIYQDSVVDSQSDFKFLETGVLANIDDMRVLSETVLNRTVDRLLDAPAFRASLRASRAGVSSISRLNDQRGTPLEIR